MNEYTNRKFFQIQHLFLKKLITDMQNNTNIMKNTFKNQIQYFLILYLILYTQNLVQTLY